MSDWLRWPRLWYATPTFVQFVALQAPDWQFTGRVYIALLVWLMVGVAIDVWMTRHPRQPGATSQMADIKRLMNGGAIFGFVLGFCALVFQPAPDSVGHVAFAGALNAALDQLGILLPALDIFHRELIQTGRFDYAAYLGSLFVLVVVMWLAEFFVFYRAFVRLSPAEFAKAIATLKAYGKPPYDPRERARASMGLMFFASLLLIALLFFGRVIPIDVAQSSQAGASVGRAYIVLGLVGWFVTVVILGFHCCRRFLSTMQPGGVLPAGESDHYAS